MERSRTTMLPFYRLEPDGSESCFLVEAQGSLEGARRAALRRGLKPCFQYRPMQDSTSRPQLKGDGVVLVGPRLTVETPFSSMAVGVMRDIGFPEVMRVEHFRRHQVGAGISNPEVLAGLHDRVLERVYPRLPNKFATDFVVPPVQTIPLSTDGLDALCRFCDANELTFTRPQLEYIAQMYQESGRRLTDVTMFWLAQVWSDHCCHLVFNAELKVDGVIQPFTMFDLVRSPYEAIKSQAEHLLVAFHDNGSVIAGHKVLVLVPTEPGQPCFYQLVEAELNPTTSAETHNYPAEESSFPAAATEIGGEERDATGIGRGSDTDFAGCGRVVGSLRFPSGYQIPGEFVAGREYVYRPNKESPIKIVRDGLRGWHSYANCFGKPCLLGFFFSGATWRPRRLADGSIGLEKLESQKPVCYGMGVGKMRTEHIQKLPLQRGYKVLRLGGPSYDIGYCGGMGASAIGSSHSETFDKNAVQRGNPVMERFFYEVERVCMAMGRRNPFVSVSDSGAGGLGSLLYDLVGKAGGTVFLALVKRGDQSMPDVKVLVCEYQEVQGFIVAEEDVPLVLQICEREGCPCDVIGEITADGKFTVYSEGNPAEVAEKQAEPVVEFEIGAAAQGMPRSHISDQTPEDIRLPLVIPPGLTLSQWFKLLLWRSEVACKRGVISTVDGSIGGRTICNQYCGPFSTPINDFALEALGFWNPPGMAASLGVMPYHTVLDSAAGARMCIGEMVTNLMGVLVSTEPDAIRILACICNWMWPANLDPHDGEIVRMIRAGEAIDETLRRLGIAIVGGKDSSSMAAKLRAAVQKLVKSLNTIVMGSLVSVPDVDRYVNPQIKYPGDSLLIQLDVANGMRRLGGSSAAQCLDGQLGDVCADLDDPELLARTYCAMQRLIDQRLICAGHDIGNGGLLTTVSEMAFANDCGLELNFGGKEADARAACLADELGYVVECCAGEEADVRQVLNDLEVPHVVLGKTAGWPEISVTYNGERVLQESTTTLRRCWQRTSFELHRLFVDPGWARREWRNTRNRRRPQYRLTFNPQPTPPNILVAKTRHKVAVLRDKGSNGQEEMAAAWLDAGFDVFDIHMSDLILGRIKDLDAFRGQIYPGGFTHGDVFGSAIGWSLKTTLHPNVRRIQERFYARLDTFSFGTCNGAQYGVRCGYAPLPDLPDREQPRFTTNKQGAFNHQWVLLRINKSPAIMLKGMAGSILGAYVAHGEGYFDCDHNPELLKRLVKMGLVPIVYVDPLGRRTTAPPYSPNGSFVAGVCDQTGRHLFVMPHLLDRTFQRRLMEYVPPEWDNLVVGPWSQLARNAREWCDQTT